MLKTEELVQHLLYRAACRPRSTAAAHLPLESCAVMDEDDDLSFFGVDDNEALEGSNTPRLTDSAPLSVGELSTHQLLQCRPGVNQSLVHLSLRNSASLTSLLELQHCQQLSSLDCFGCTSLRCVRGLQHCGVGLQELVLSECTNLQDLTGLEQCGQLRTLDLSGRVHSMSVTDIEPIQSCSLLRELSLRRCDKLVNLAPLEGLLQLHTLDLEM